MDFDRQADRFDRRAGLPDPACDEVVGAVMALATPEAADLCLEIGAGTGQLGRRFAARLRYLGLDASAAMLAGFRRGGGPGSATALVQADAARRWPLADGCARIVFGSRVLHLLAPRHVADEAARVAAPGGAWLLIGQVTRHPDAVRSRLRAMLHELLAARGYPPRARASVHAEILTAARALGASPVRPRTVYQWTVTTAPAASLAAWRSKPGLAGLPLPPGDKREVLGELEALATRAFGALDQASDSVESYRLEGACWV